MEIELLNKIYPYVGQYPLNGLDHKNRLPIPSDLVGILSNRKKALGLNDRLIYYSAEIEDPAILILRDYILEKEKCPNFYKSNVDMQNRLTIKKKVADNLDPKRDLVCVGYGDHIRIYSQQGWQKIQRTE